MSEITRDQAEQFIKNYCDDDPVLDAIDKMLASDIELTERTTIHWLDVANGVGAEQDVIDNLIYDM